MMPWKSTATVPSCNVALHSCRYSPLHPVVSPVASVMVNTPDAVTVIPLPTVFVTMVVESDLRIHVIVAEVKSIKAPVALFVFVQVNVFVSPADML